MFFILEFNGLHLTWRAVNYKRQKILKNQIIKFQFISDCLWFRIWNLFGFW